MSNFFTLSNDEQNTILELIASKTIDQVFAEMIENSGLPVIELKTFGMIVTDIYRLETGETHHHVTLWKNEQVSVTAVNGDWAALIALHDWGKQLSPDDAMDLYNQAIDVGER